MTEAQKRKAILYKTCFGTDAGKEVLKDLETFSYIKKDPFDPASERITCYNLGAACIVRYIHEQINKNVDQPVDEKVIHRPTVI